MVGAQNVIQMELPPGTDIMTFQKQRSKELKAKRHNTITSNLFGCSTDKNFRDEAFPPLRHS